MIITLVTHLFAFIHTGIFLKMPAFRIAGRPLDHIKRNLDKETKYKIVENVYYKRKEKIIEE